MSKELKFEFNDYIIAIDEPYEKDCGYVAIGKKDTKGNINIWFKSLNEQTVDFYIELQKHIADLETKLADYNTRIVEEMELSAERRQIIENLTIENRGLERKLADMEQEQISEMKEHQEVMQVADHRIKELKKQLAETEKALELACDFIRLEGYCFGSKDSLDCCGNGEPCSICIQKRFKTKAKEMKSE